MARIALTILAAALTVAPAAAQQRGPEDPVQTEVEPAKARVGDVVEVRGTGWAPDSRVEITFRGRPLGFATVSADGTWEEDVMVPSVEPPAAIGLVVSGTSVTGEDTTFEVTLDVATGTPRGTWIVVGLVAFVVLLVLILGWAMLVRRRQPTLAQRAAEGETPVRNPDPRKEPQPHDEGR